ncbi:MAG: hypothetical protein ACRDOH_30915, partial [Streptosporangiaceae bacterium]
VLWILGDLVGLPFLAAQLIQMMREDESDAAMIDADLDARDAERQAAVAARDGEPGDGEPGAGEPGAGEPGDGEPGEGTKPWWEDDPRFTSRFKPT